MKFTQISTLALAAMMAFSSCSKEEVMDSGEANLQPGEAQIVLDLGRKGATTYSTEVAEKVIKNGNAKLFINKPGDATHGTEIPMNETAIGANGVLNAKVSAENVAKGAGPVTLYIFLNAVDGVTDGTGTTAKDKYDAGTVATVINRDLTNGAPAGLSVDFTLTPGSNKITTKAAKRAIARVGATNMSTETSIKDFTIAFDGVNLTKGAIFDGSVVTGATLVALPAYTLANSGLVKDTTMYSGNETVAYMYPSATVTATVTSPDGLEKKVSFAPKANMNYSIKINPKKPASGPGDIDFTVSIDEWVDAGDDLEADFNEDLLNVEFLPLPAEFAKATLEDEKIILDALTAASEISIELGQIVTATGDAFDKITNIEVGAASAYTAGKPVYAKVEAVGTTAIKVSQAVNLSGVKSPDIKVIVTGESGGKPVSGYFKICVGPVSQDYVNAMNEATVEMDGKKWVMFDQKEDIGWCYERALAIKAAGGFTEETIRNNHNLFMLTEAVSMAAKCPKGYKVPTLADYISLMDTHKVGGGIEPKWVSAVGDTKEFTNKRVLRNVWNDGKNSGQGYYTLTEGAKVMHITASKGYQTTTPTDGSLGDTPVVAGNFYTFAPWSDGITFGQAGGNANTEFVSLRCIVDPTYVDAGL